MFVESSTRCEYENQALTAPDKVMPIPRINGPADAESKPLSEKQAAKDALASSNLFRVAGIIDKMLRTN